MRVGLLADAFGWNARRTIGEVLDLAVHFHLELALANAYWFEMRSRPSGPTALTTRIRSELTPRVMSKRLRNRALVIRSTATLWIR